jgi:predicted AlkP superfamily phosphohydrolase/phosphomutase
VQALDHLQHFFWDDVARDRAAGATAGARPGREGRATVVDRCYHLADDIIGHRAGLLEGSTHLFVVSDHGFGPARKWFHVNRFLQEHGLLALGGAEGSSGLAARLGLTPQAVRSAVRRLDVLGLRHRMGRMARVSLGRRIDEQLTPPVDWARTRAIAGSPATEGIYVNLRGREPHGIVEQGTAYEALRDRLVGELRALRDPETGEPVVQAVYRREEIYDGPFLDQLPDVVFGLGDGPYLASDLLTAEEVLAPLSSDYLQGRHQPTGVFVAAGPGIRRGLHLDGVHIVDVAPTVLYALGLPIPDDMDGRPLLEIFGEEYRAAHPVAYAPPVAVEGDREAPAYDDEDRAEMERRLQGLGYMS